MNALRILLLEDDWQLQNALRSTLEAGGHQVSTCKSLREAQACMLQHLGTAQAMELVLLDLNLPDGLGDALLDWMNREGIECPVIVTSATFDDARKVQLLDAGARDYLVKPFSAAELMARIRVLFRYKVLTTPNQPGPNYVQAGLTVDLGKREVLRHGEAVHLTPKEFALLALMVEHAGEVLTHRQLLKHAWGADYVDHLHYLRLFMAQLRSKLEDNPNEPSLILTETGVGYRLKAADTP
ncbi:response regulator transcription factor [Limnobacter humi]|uniref:Response regulator transcription factor n=1 Tax=Limnobacter humi TaxID=1778671 RepID=A0ABT1WC08_9BURK|nr:response regulator transcription factor [Limnobacter humi]MCQ8895046.1 response regulator transcription factor [Limnobacter humi]